MKKRISSKRPIAGFTLIEALVVIIMAGILFAIAAPSWIGFLNRQRLSTARGQVFEILRAAQADAKRTKVSRAVFFDNKNLEKKPRVIVVPYKKEVLKADGTVDTAATSTPSGNDGRWQVLGNGDIKEGVIKIAGKPNNGSETASGNVVFDTYGNVDQNILTMPYTITIQTTNVPSPKRCVKVTTLLGAMASAEDSECN
ncbi:MAG: prepilin-type N-terminal cleavage/methylation domain-containing protein [Phormidesmis sp. CAN_BIN36]|nr:prepilin-type N-terminal cleavage/methylation domain-containing protein [Phormidesmis sp. CAN_BIN36]